MTIPIGWVLVLAAEPPAGMALGPYSVPVPDKWTLSYVHDVSKEPKIDGFKEKFLDGDAVLVDADRPGRSLVLVRYTGFQSDTSCAGVEGKAMALGGKVDSQMDMILPDQACLAQLSLPDNKVELVRTVSHTNPVGTLEISCFGDVAEVERVRKVCDDIFMQFEHVATR